MIMARPDRLSSTSRTNSDSMARRASRAKASRLDPDREHADPHDAIADREAVAATDGKPHSLAR